MGTDVVVPLLFSQQTKTWNWLPVRSLSLGALAASTWHSSFTCVHVQSILNSLSEVTQPDFCLKGSRTDAYLSASPTVCWSDVWSPCWFSFQFAAARAETKSDVLAGKK